MKNLRILLISSLLIVLIAGAFWGTFSLSPFFSNSRTGSDAPPVFMGLIIDQNDASVPYFLKSIEKMDYDKSKISMEIHLLNDRKGVDRTVRNWAHKNQDAYGSILVVDEHHFLPTDASSNETDRLRGMIKNSMLKGAQERKCRYCFITNSEVFLEPQTLSYLVDQRKPVIAPMLRPIPQPGDVNRNFFCDVTEAGYYKDHPNYTPISKFEKQGTFQVPCVHAAYLIDTDFADRLSFTKGFTDWEFVAFSKNARDNKIQQYISNEQEFGFMLHFKEGTTKEEERAFVPVNPDTEVTKVLVEGLVSPYYKQNPYLEKKVKEFPLGVYTLFRIQNRDLFFLDDVNDLIKKYILKLGVNWEEQIHEEFKKHVKPGTTALDIGGHIGTHTLNLSRIVGDRGTVHVFEPQPKIFCELAINMHLNRCRNVVLHPQALGVEKKEIEIHFPEEAWVALIPGLVNEGHGTVTEASDNLEEAKGDRTVMIRLDDLGLDNISFIKIDVEGFEMDVIHGGIETIKRSMPTMIVEIFKNEKKNEKINEIESLGYKSSSLGGDDYLFEPLANRL